MHLGGKIRPDASFKNPTAEGSLRILVRGGPGTDADESGRRENDRETNVKKASTVTSSTAWVGRKALLSRVMMYVNWAPRACDCSPGPTALGLSGSFRMHFSHLRENSSTDFRQPEHIEEVPDSECLEVGLLSLFGVLHSNLD